MSRKKARQTSTHAQSDMWDALLDREVPKISRQRWPRVPVDEDTLEDPNAAAFESLMDGQLEDASD